jgi:hypothetical protein
MKSKSIFSPLLLLLLGLSILPATLGASENSQFPTVSAPVQQYDFGTVPEGVLVNHEFAVENKGGPPLSIRKAVSSCSCLTIQSYDELILPGETGNVSVSLDTDGYGGGEVTRQIAVKTSDPEMPQLTLTVSGHVDKTYVISSEIVKLSGRAGERVSETVKIFPEEKYDFKVIGVRTKQGKYIECSFEEIVEDGRSGCLLTIEGLKGEKGLFFDKIFVDTDSTVVPGISIGVFGKIEES